MLASLAPRIVVDKAEVEEDEHLKPVIKKYSNKQNFMMQQGDYKSAEMQSIEDLSVKSISGTSFAVELKHRLGTGPELGRIEYATSQIEKTAESYKFISFDGKR